MVLDGHVHVFNETVDQAGLLARMREGGVDGGIILSLPSATFGHVARPLPNERRMTQALACCAGVPSLFPFYWIDPTEEDACEQADEAARQGMAGFKVICDRFYPGDERAMRVFRRIASLRKPILFHSGILWDGKASSKYNRPAEFEALLEVDHLRFAMAHISWPWCDELIAIYGKFANAKRRRPELSVEMFIDTTPGTPKIYRTEALTKLMTVGYDVDRNIFFGTDGQTDSYDPACAKDWIATDRRILGTIGVSEERMRYLFSDNLRRFVGASAG